MKYDETSDRSLAALQEDERKLRAILNTVIDAIITIDSRGTITGVNPATLRMFGYTEPELIGQNVSVLMPEPYRSEHDRYLARYQETGEARIIGIGREVAAQRKDGSVFPIELAVSEFYDAAGPMFAGIIHDISLRRELEKHLAEAPIKEQQRVARELHDGLGGQMTGIAMLVKALRKRLEAEGSPYAAELAGLARHVDDAHAQLRAISRGLAPVEVLASGLIQALADLAAKVSHGGEVCCDFVCDQVTVHNPTVAMHLYRIAQEAVSNAVRHGQPSRIEIRLDQDDGHVVLTIGNNGRSIQHLTDTGQGMGIRTMKHRSDLIGGVLRLAPAEGGGTVVICRAPNPRVQP